MAAWNDVGRGSEELWQGIYHEEGALSKVKANVIAYPRTPSANLGPPRTTRSRTVRPNWSAFGAVYNLSIHSQRPSR